MAIPPGRQPSPNPKFPFVGPNYLKYGDTQGYVYNPYTDKYAPDPNAQKELEIAQGLRPPDPKSPSLASTLLPVAGIAGAYEIGKGLGSGNSPLLESGKGLLGLGDTASTAGKATQVTTPTLNASQSGLAAANDIGTFQVGESMYPGGAAYPAAPEAAGMFDLGGIGSAGNAILPAAGAYGVYDLATHDRGPVGGALEGAASGAAIGSGFAGVGAIPGAIIGGGLGLAKGLFFEHKSTRDIAKEHTQNLLNKGKDDATWQQYVSGMREQYNSAPPDPSKPFHAGQYGSWDEYKTAGLDANDLTGVYGNLKVYGPQWATLTEDQRKAVTQANINSGLYYSKKGEVELNDEQKAKDNLNSVLSGKLQPTNTSTENPKQATNPIQAAGGLLGVNKGPAQINTPVVATKAAQTGISAPHSPGFDKNGKRINYGLMGAR